jgi:YD repeat-containing protein
VETYDGGGKLQSVRERNGRTTTLTYNAKAQLAQVTAASGRSLTFAYDAQGRVSSITAPDGAITQYAYNANGMLTTVTWPDNTTRQYVYEDTRFPTALTGVIDEAGVRYATYAYDDQGRAITSELTAGADRYQFQYQANGQTTVLTPDGGSSTYSFLKQNGVLLPTGVSAPCPLCGNTALSTSYDSNNNATSKTGYDGSTTSYTYDTLGRETQRIEGAGTANAKTTTTEWHPTLDVPAKVASPGKLETFGYDGAGNLVSYTTVATTDASGAAGLNATPTGDVTKTDWTFDSAGRVVAATEAIGGTTTGTWALTYDAQGNVQTFTDPDGRTANAVSYDAAGRLQEAINTDGERMKYSYNSRGLLTAYDVDGAVVNCDYDANGLLTAIRGPGDYYFGFKYDAAHRLIALLTPAGQAAVASAANPIQAARLAMTAEAQRTAKLSLVERLLIKAKSWLAKLLSFVVGEATANPALVETAVAPPIPAQAGGGVGGVSSGNRDLDELIGTSRPMLGADALLSDFNKSVRKIGNILGVTQSSSEACEDDSRCESAKQKAASIYHNLTAKRFPQYLSGGTRGSDKTHYETIKAKQSGLRDALRRVRLYCRPLPAELPEWERVANQDVPILF